MWFTNAFDSTVLCPVYPTQLNLFKYLDHEDEGAMDGYHESFLHTHSYPIKNVKLHAQSSMRQWVIG